ncbi:hypothetical protein MBLNU13_g07474t1 [Cladosporium sp. NU13]
MIPLTILWAIFLLPLPATAILRLKLQRWFLDDSDYWINAASKCEAEITAYLINNRTEVCPTPCSCAADCILSDIPGTLESNYASAQVILGLVPAVLLLIGPSIAEVAAISTRRPLLAVLIALGCPTSYLGRVFRRVDIREPLMLTDRSIIGTTLGGYLTKRYSGNATVVDASGMAKRCHRQVTIHVVDLAMYALALLAISNGMQISIYTDLRTISGWRCGALFMPMVWFLMGIVEHGWGMIAARVQRWPDRQLTGATEAEPVNAHTSTSPSGSHVSVPNLDSQSQTAPQPHIKLCDTQKPLSWLQSLLASNLYTQLLEAQPTLWSEFIFWFAQASALVHMIFGIFELSSLVFISALESVQVFARFALSIVLCQIVVQIELAMIRAELQILGAFAVSTSIGLPGSATAIVDSQGGSHQQILLSDVSRSIRSHGSGGNGGQGDHGVEGPAPASENTSAT